MKRLHERHKLNGDIERVWNQPSADQPEQLPKSLVTLTPDREIDCLHASIDELNISLEKATRRINRLLGEKSQLASLLEKRDDQIQHLNRELGACASGHGPPMARGRSKSSFRSLGSTAFTSIAKLVRIFFVERSKAVKAVEDGQQHTDLKKDKCAPLVARSLGSIERPILVAMMFGLKSDEIERLLPIIEGDCSSRQMSPLCLVDIDQFELLRERGLLFEFLPPAEDRERFDSSLHWDLYFQRRLALIRKKWNPVRIVAFGGSATRMLSLWSRSPFEESPLPAVTAGNSAL